MGCPGISRYHRSGYHGDQEQWYPASPAGWGYRWLPLMYRPVKYRELAYHPVPVCVCVCVTHPYKTLHPTLSYHTTLPYTTHYVIQYTGIQQNHTIPPSYTNPSHPLQCPSYKKIPLYTPHYATHDHTNHYYTAASLYNTPSYSTTLHSPHHDITIHHTKLLMQHLTMQHTINHPNTFHATPNHTIPNLQYPIIKRSSYEIPSCGICYTVHHGIPHHTILIKQHTIIPHHPNTASYNPLSSDTHTG